MKKLSWKDKVANYFGYVKEVAVSSLGGLNLPAFPAAKEREYLEAYRGWVYACVKARATGVSNISLRLYRVIDRNTGEVEEVKEHDVLSLLRRVNLFMTQTDLFEYTQAYKDLAGEAFWYLLRAKNRMIVNVWLLRPDWVSINVDNNGLVSSYTYRVPGRDPVSIDKEDIIHHKEFNPVNPHRGLGIVGAAALTIDAETYAEQYNVKFFTNSGIPSVILKTEQKLDEALRNRMRAEWQKEYGGTNKSHRMAILEAGLDLQPFSISQKDMEFLGGQNFTRDKIFALFQVPKSILGMTENVTVSNADATDAIFSKRVISPLMKKMAGTLTEFLLPLYKNSEDLFFSFDDPSPENVLNKLERYKALVGIGAMTPNEVRAEEGLDQVSGLDNFYLSGMMVPIVFDGQNGEEKSVSFRRQRARMQVPPLMLKEKVRKDIAVKIKDDVVKGIMNELRISEKKVAAKELQQSSIPYETQEAYWKGFVAKSENFERSFLKELKEVFDRQEAQTIKRLEATQKALTRGDIEKVLFTLSAENKVTAGLMVPILASFMEEAGNDALELLGLSDMVFDTTSANMSAFFRGDALKGIKSMNKTTRSALRQVLAQSVKDGEGIPEISRKIRAVFQDASTRRATLIARTEVIKAGNRAALEAYIQSGVVAGKQWFTALDEQVCEWCGKMQGLVTKTDETFFDMGETFVGKNGGVLQLDYENIETPPLHSNCRCTLIPITVNRRSATPQKKESDEIAEAIREEYEQKMEKMKDEHKRELKDAREQEK